MQHYYRINSSVLNHFSTVAKQQYQHDHRRLLNRPPLASRSPTPFTDTSYTTPPSHLCPPASGRSNPSINYFVKGLCGPFINGGGERPLGADPSEDKILRSFPVLTLSGGSECSTTNSTLKRVPFPISVLTWICPFASRTY